MSMGEVMWRASSLRRDVVDRGRLAVGWRPAPPPELLADGEPGLRIADVEVGEWARAGATPEEDTWRRRLLARADRIVAHRLSFFSLEARHLGDPIDWNRDHESGRAAPLRFAPWIDYRDLDVTGDAKVVWEPNRHLHLVVLARAYRASGERRYADAVLEQIDSWLRACPFGWGMNWLSPLELAIRLINWVWSLDLIRESGLLRGDIRARILSSVHLHAREITRRYSRGSSANNHLIGEATGVFVACCYFPALDRSGRWRRESRDILSREIAAQTYADGCTREQAIGYHLFVLQFLLVAAFVARATGEDLGPDYVARLGRMLEFVSALLEGGEALPAFGDADDGYVLDLGDGGLSPRGLLSAGGVLLGRADLRASAGGVREEARWLAGGSAARALEGTPCLPTATLPSRGFAESGHYLLQCGRAGTDDRISVFFDCGELGFGPIAAHGHADALSFVLRAYGLDVLVDPGTYDYFTFPRWRRYFRSTRAHNTLVADGKDQSEMRGPFLWGPRARARCLAFAPREGGGSVTAEHDGYGRLADPLVHRRHLELDGRLRLLIVRDDVQAAGEHEIELFFHVAEGCRVDRVGPGRYDIETGRGIVTIALDPRLAVETLVASEDPPGGWVSRRYHVRSASTTLVGRARTHGPASFECRLEVGPPNGVPS
jgi:Heparinase II/III-like protein/Heparinase II/III N-terminus